MTPTNFKKAQTLRIKIEKWQQQLVKLENALKSEYIRVEVFSYFGIDYLMVDRNTNDPRYGADPYEPTGIPPEAKQYIQNRITELKTIIANAEKDFEKL